MLLHLWIGWARHPGPSPRQLAIEVFNVGDMALEAQVDFLAVVEHRLIPARVRCEWARLWEKGLATIWAPASQDSSHVGNAGVALPTFATAQFRRFFDCGRAIRCMLPFFVLPGSCTWKFCTVIKVLILMLSSLLKLSSCSILLQVSWVWWLGSSLFDSWGLQRGTHQNPLPGKRDSCWALGLTWKLPGRLLVVFSLLLHANVLGIPQVVVEEILWWLPSCHCCGLFL